jgi:hypothetical protein
VRVNNTINSIYFHINRSVRRAILINTKSVNFGCVLSVYGIIQGAEGFFGWALGPSERLTHQNEYILR